MDETNQTQEVQPVTDDLDAFTNEFFGQNSEPQETPPASEDPVEVEDTEQDEAGESAESDEEVTEDEEVEVEPEPEPAPKKQTVQERINELVRQREEAKREGEAQLAALRKEFEEKIAALKPAEPVKAEKAEPAPDDLNEDGTPKYDLGEFDPQYIRDLTRYTLEQERNQAVAKAAEEAKVAEERKAYETLTGQWNEKVEAAKASYPDFMEKGQELLGSFNGLDESYATYLSTLLMSMDKGPDVLYYLSQNPAEAVTIVNSGAQKATLALGRIEAKFLEADATKVLAKPKVSKAPTPPPPAARSRGSNGAFVSVSPDTDDLDAFEAEFYKKKK